MWTGGLRIGAAVLIAAAALFASLPDARAQSPGAAGPVAAVETGLCRTDEVFAVALHGGALFWRGQHAAKVSFARELLAEARAVLGAGARAIDVVESVVAAMEDSGRYNAGKGSIANKAGVVEMDAAIMEGRLQEAGAVAAVKAVRNPISAARLVMERSRHILLVGPDADRFVEEAGGAVAEVAYFHYGGRNYENVPLPDDLAVTPPSDAIAPDKAGFSGAWAGVFQGQINHVLVVEAIEPERARVVYALGPHPFYGEAAYRRLEGVFVDDGLKVVEPNELGGYTTVYSLNPDGTMTASGSAPGEAPEDMTLRRYDVPARGDGGGTVGAVVRDRCGDLAAGTSTGGFGSKTPGRVGDVPLIGAGTYADNETAAVSATGHGEYFMRHVAAHAIAAAMKHGGLSLDEAARGLIEGDLARKGLRGGVIAVDRDGTVVMPFNTEGMVRGAATNALPPSVEAY